jgi:hypothetical protein
MDGFGDIGQPDVLDDIGLQEPDGAAQQHGRWLGAVMRCRVGVAAGLCLLDGQLEEPFTRIRGEFLFS